MAQTVCGTPYYFSPELCRSRPYNNKSDVWAVGVVLYELATSKHPFDGSSMQHLMQRITRGAYAPLPPTFSREFHQLVTSCLQKDPAARPSVKQLLQLDIIRSGLQKLQDALAVAQTKGLPLQQVVSSGSGGAHPPGAAPSAAPEPNSAPLPPPHPATKPVHAISENGVAPSAVPSGLPSDAPPPVKANANLKPLVVVAPPALHPIPVADPASAMKPIDDFIAQLAKPPGVVAKEAFANYELKRQQREAAERERHLKEVERLEQLEAQRKKELQALRLKRQEAAAREAAAREAAAKELAAKEAQRKAEVQQQHMARMQNIVGAHNHQMAVNKQHQKRRVEKDREKERRPTVHSSDDEVCRPPPPPPPRDNPSDPQVHHPPREAEVKRAQNWVRKEQERKRRAQEKMDEDRRAVAMLDDQILRANVKNRVVDPELEAWVRREVRKGSEGDNNAAPDAAVAQPPPAIAKPLALDDVQPPPRQSVRHSVQEVDRLLCQYGLEPNGGRVALVPDEMRRAISNPSSPRDQQEKPFVCDAPLPSEQQLWARRGGPKLRPSLDVVLLEPTEMPAVPPRTGRRRSETGNGKPRDRSAPAELRTPQRQSSDVNPVEPHGSSPTKDELPAQSELQYVPTPIRQWMNNEADAPVVVVQPAIPRTPPREIFGEVEPPPAAKALPAQEPLSLAPRDDVPVSTTPQLLSASKRLGEYNAMQSHLIQILTPSSHAAKAHAPVVVSEAPPTDIVQDEDYFEDAEPITECPDQLVLPASGQSGGAVPTDSGDALLDEEVQFRLASLCPPAFDGKQPLCRSGSPIFPQRSLSDEIDGGRALSAEQLRQQLEGILGLDRFAQVYKLMGGAAVGVDRDEDADVLSCVRSLLQKAVQSLPPAAARSLCPSTSDSKKGGEGLSSSDEACCDEEVVEEELVEELISRLAQLVFFDESSNGCQYVQVKKAFCA